MFQPVYQTSAAWRAAMKLTVWLHRRLARRPRAEAAGLAGAMRRCATAATQQLANADGRAAPEAAVAAYDTALGALRELDTAAQICRRLKHLKARDLRGLRRGLHRLAALIEADRDTAQREARGEPGPGRGGPVVEEIAASAAQPARRAA